MSFKDLDEFFDDTLRLPIGGKTYVIPPVSAKVGLWLQQVFTTAIAAQAGATISDADRKAMELDDAQELNLYQTVLGPCYDEMIADGVSWPRLRHAGWTAVTWAAGNRELAETIWAEGEGGPKAPRRPQDRKRKAR